MALMFAALGPVLPSIADHFGGNTGGAFAAQMILTMPAIGVIFGGIAGGLSVERWAPGRSSSRHFSATGCSVSAAISSRKSRHPAGVALFPRLLRRAGRNGDRSHRRKLVRGCRESEAARVPERRCGSSRVSGLLLSAPSLADVGGWRAPFLLYAFAFVASLPRPRQPSTRAQATRPSAVSGRRPPSIWPGLPI